MLFKLNCSDCPCSTGKDNFCNSFSREYFVHLNRIVLLRQLYVAGKIQIKFSSIQSWDSGTTFWNTTPSFGTPPRRAARPRRNNENTNRPASPIQGRSSGATFWNTTHRAAGPPTRPRATPYMVRVLVQPLEHHPTEPPGHQPDRDNIEWGFWDTFQ